MNLNEKLEKIGVKVPNILLPKKNIDLSKFSCIAQDQYTHNVSYWDKVKAFINGDASTFNLIFPEAYLENIKENDKEIIIEEKIQNIEDAQKEYLQNIYESIGNCFVLIERQIGKKTRTGLILAIDLEQYDYSENSHSLIRATELTVKNRLENRRKIRERSSLDIPHVLVLINDKENSVMKEAKKVKNDKSKILYDFDLMMNGGHIKGYKIDDNDIIEKIVDALLKLKNNSKDNLLFAVGDGNHSLAAAKDAYIKTGKGRFALVEVENIFDEGLEFFPIHRLLMNVNKNEFEKETNININNPPSLQDTQILIDKYLQKHPESKLDYIHGKENCEELGKNEGNISITFDKFSHDTLFDDVIKHGSLCRKSFSMGNANDKRFYLEACEIK